MDENKTIKEEVKEMDEDTRIGSVLDFNNIFRIKGKRGLFSINSNVNKSGLINMVSFLNFKEKYTVRVGNLVRLGDLKFSLIDGNKLLMSDVFNNYEKCLSERTAPRIGSELMEILVPNYDPDEFKDYHAKQVVKWYDEIQIKMELNEKETQASQS